MKDETSKQITLLHKKVAQLLDIPYTTNQIIEELSKDGIDEQYALTLIENVRRIAENKEASKKYFLIATICFASSIGLTLISGGTFIFYGLVGGGILSLAKGFNARNR